MTEVERDDSFAMVARRAAPRVLLVLVLTLAALTAEVPMLRVLAVVLLVMNGMRMFTIGWRHYVRTGERWDYQQAG